MCLALPPWPARAFFPENGKSEQEIGEKDGRALRGVVGVRLWGLPVPILVAAPNYVTPEGSGLICMRPPAGDRALSVNSHETAHVCRPCRGEGDAPFLRTFPPPESLPLCSLHTCDGLRHMEVGVLPGESDCAELMTYYCPHVQTDTH